MVSINAAVFNALYGGSTTTGVGADLLANWASAKAGIGVDVAAASQDPNAPLAPVWTPGVSPSAEALVQRALTNKSFFDVDAKLYADLGATGDYKRLFALYSGLTTLQALAGRSEDETLKVAEKAATTAQFARGLSELQAFFEQQQFEDIRLAQADRVDSAQTTLAMPTKTEDYTTGIIHRGGLFSTFSGLAPNAKFDIVATSAGGTVRTVAIDFAQMGSLPRTLGNIISFVNGKLSAAGAASRLEAVDQTPKENKIVIAGQTVTSRYSGPKQYALKVDVRANERVAFQAVAPEPAFYVLGDLAAGGSRLIKLEDVSDATGQPVQLDRPGATADPIGALVSAGYAGAVYEQRTGALTSAGANTFETALRAAGEAMVKLDLADGRTVSVSTAWRAGDQESWRALSGQSEDAAIVGDLAERLNQLLHEQGVAARVQAWESGGESGLSVFTADGVRASSVAISGKKAALQTIDPVNMVGGLREGVFARRFEAAGVETTGALFVGAQTFDFTTAQGTQSITINGGDAGIDAATLATQLNEKLRANGLSAAAYLVDNSGSLTFRIDALHNVLSVDARLNGDTHDAALQAPGAWAQGGLPNAGAGAPYGDAVRTWTTTSSPLTTHTGAVDIEIVLATPNGAKTINVSVSALERAGDPDPSPGQWSATFQARLDAALNEAGVYVGAPGGELTQWAVAEESGQRLVSVKVNGDALALSADTPAYGAGGAFSAERSFTSTQGAATTSTTIAALATDQAVSLKLDTIWGERTVTATLEPGDPRTLESAALRLNEALAAQGYDAGVVATDLSGGGAGLRVVTGGSHSIRGVAALTLGADTLSATLDPVDAATHSANPVGALRAHERANRGAAAIETRGASGLSAPTNGVSNWFPGRAFDIAIGGGAKVATARAIASAADGSVFVLADLSGDSATSAIKGARDVALLKYDSAGKLVFTEMLGASQSASGFALAVSADGKVAVAGSVEGALSGANGAVKGGGDSFVTMFDSAGKELWSQRRGATANDEVRAIAFAPDGGVVVSGRTESALGPSLSAGGADGYVRGFSANGVEQFTRQFGTSGDDVASALVVRSAGAGVEIITGGVENNRGVLRRFTYSSASGLGVGPTRDIGNFYGGAINALAADGANLYVGGEIGADRLALGATAQVGVAGEDGFVARLNIDLASTGLDRATYLGSTKDDAVVGLSVVGGAVYAAGVTGGLMTGVGNPASKSNFIVRLDSDGQTDWARTFISASGPLQMTGLAASASNSSALDALGLPSGLVASNDTGRLTERSALRVGDEFKIGVDGRRLTTIRINANDTLASLVANIGRAIGSGGRAEIVRENGLERIKITPRANSALLVEPGAAGRDALGALGLSQGVIAVNQDTRGSLRTYGLGLIAADLKLDTKAATAKTKAELSAAISIVRQAYDRLLNPNQKALTDEEKALETRRQNAGAAPEYYSAQLANYQAALARLGGL